ncbi:MAG: acyl carrier protein [Acidobacteria bacterium]|nr:acyl carrier protein [Acidobacteriota bacterium]
MTPAEVQEQIRTILVEQANVEVPNPDFDLIDSGVMDSLTFVDMLFQIEQRFRVSLEIESLELDDIRSVASLGRLVLAKIA